MHRLIIWPGAKKGPRTVTNPGGSLFPYPWPPYPSHLARGESPRAREAFGGEAPPTPCKDPGVPLRPPKRLAPWLLCSMVDGSGWLAGLFQLAGRASR